MPGKCCLLQCDFLSDVSLIVKINAPVALITRRHILQDSNLEKKKSCFFIDLQGSQEPPLDPVLNQNDPVRTLAFCFHKIHVNGI